MQNSHTAFNDEQLKYAMPELNAIGLPRPLSGAFATVYRLSNAGKEWAVKCFTEPVIDHQQRYAAISKSLRQIALPFFTEFSYLPNGIKLQGEVYPILKMSWVHGQALNVALASQLGNREALSKMSATFVQMANAMEVHGIAHGDLQHGNILVRPDGFTLVDYDGMYVPELAGKQSNEIGHRNYQHPRRAAEHFGPYLDHFSVWVIYVSFFILSRHPELWEQLDCGDESLLFKQTDFMNPNESKTFQLLKSHEDVDVQRATMSMLEFLQMAPENVPSVSKFFHQGGVKH